MKNCIFCKIAKGESKSWKIYEDKDVIAFLDINPASEGHTLIIPKKHYEDIYEIPEKELKKIISLSKKLALHYKKFGINEVNVMHASGKNAQQSVPHFHIHLIPRCKGDGLDLWFKAKNKTESDFQEIKDKLKLVK